MSVGTPLEKETIELIFRRKREGLSVKQIAERLGITTAAVYNILNHYTVELESEKYVYTRKVKAYTPREQIVLGLILKGLSNKEIANIIDTSEGNVKSMLSGIYHKAGVKTRYELYVKLMEQRCAKCKCQTTRGDGDCGTSPEGTLSAQSGTLENEPSATS